MITVKQHEKLIDKISKLSELELDDLLKDIGLHLRKNNLEHLINSAFQIDDFEGEIDELNNKLEKVEEKLEDAESEKQHLESKIEDAVELLEEMQEEPFSEDWGKNKIEQVLTILK
jgi:chromosome segregation ATPase